MRITVNGKERDVPDGASLGDLLAQVAPSALRLAVEHNGRPLDAEAMRRATLSPGDTVEIVRFVGGG